MEEISIKSEIEALEQFTEKVFEFEKELMAVVPLLRGGSNPEGVVLIQLWHKFIMFWTALFERKLVTMHETPKAEIQLPK